MAEIPDAVREAAVQAGREAAGVEWMHEVADYITHAVLDAITQRCAVLELPDTVPDEDGDPSVFAAGISVSVWDGSAGPLVYSDPGDMTPDEVAAAYAACARVARAMARQAAPEVTG